MRISVICSNYNSKEWIEDYLRSLNAQFLKDFEVVFIDANSTDGSLDTIRNFLFRDGIRVQIIESKERITIYEAWNQAIKKCTGDFVVNYNTDDHLYPSALSTYSGYMHANDVDVIYPNNFVHEEPVNKEHVTLNLWPQYSHDILKVFCICGPFPCVRKSAIEKVGYFDAKYKSSGDYDMWLKLSKNKFRFLKIPEVVGTFFRRANSVSSNLAMAQAEDREIQGKY